MRKALMVLSTLKWNIPIVVTAKLLQELVGVSCASDCRHCINLLVPRCLHVAVGRAAVIILVIALRHCDVDAGWM